MSQMEIFKNPEFGSIRVIEENGNYLFCGTDIAAALGYSNPRKAVRDHTPAQRSSKRFTRPWAAWDLRPATSWSRLVV